MSKLVSIDQEGVTHVFESELEEFIQCDQWIKKNKTEEEYNHWKEQSYLEEKTDESIQLYNDWLVANKIKHTMTFPTGAVITNIHSELE